MSLPTRTLGTLQVSALGLGCMGMSVNYGERHGLNSRPEHIRQVVDASLRRQKPPHRVRWATEQVSGPRSSM